MGWDHGQWRLAVQGDRSLTEAQLPDFVVAMRSFTIHHTSHNDGAAEMMKQKTNDALLPAVGLGTCLGCKQLLLFTARKRRSWFIVPSLCPSDFRFIYPQQPLLRPTSPGARTSSQAMPVSYIGAGYDKGLGRIDERVRMPMDFVGLLSAFRLGFEGQWQRRGR